MKELYISPEVEITCFAPVEDIANDFWESNNGGGALFSSRAATSPVVNETVDPNEDFDGEMN